MLRHGTFLWQQAVRHGGSREAGSTGKFVGVQTHTNAQTHALTHTHRDAFAGCCSDWYCQAGCCCKCCWCAYLAGPATGLPRSRLLLFRQLLRLPLLQTVNILLRLVFLFRLDCIRALLLIIRAVLLIIRAVLLIIRV